MANYQEVRDTVAAEKVEVQRKLSEVEAEIQTLKDQIVAGNGTTPAQLDQLNEDIKNIFVASNNNPPILPTP